MRLLPVLVLAAVATLVAAAVGLGLAQATAGEGRSADQRARAAAAEFFRALNEGRYERVCRLLSAGYYERHKVRDGRECAIGPRAGMHYAETRFRITGVEASGDRATVSALANGAAGTIELVRERGRYRVLSLDGA